MIFKQAQQVLDGTKTQTRRPVKEGDAGVICSGKKPLEFIQVRSGWGIRLKWWVGKTYAVQPGRGKKSIGRIRITKIRRERLHKIGPDGLRAEGFPKDILDCWASWLDRWEALWNSLYRKPYRWKDDIEVWCLSFELVG